MSPGDITGRPAQLYPQALRSLFVAFYYSLDYGGGILTQLHKEQQKYQYTQNIFIINIYRAFSG
jgi:hypothetical protein